MVSFTRTIVRGRRSRYSALHATKLTSSGSFRVGLAGPLRPSCRRWPPHCPPPIPTARTWCWPTWPCRAGIAAAAPIATSRPPWLPATAGISERANKVAVGLPAGRCQRTRRAALAEARIRKARRPPRPSRWPRCVSINPTKPAPPSCARMRWAAMKRSSNSSAKPAIPAAPPSRWTRCAHARFAPRCRSGCCPRAWTWRSRLSTSPPRASSRNACSAEEPASGVARAQLARVLTAEGDAVAAIAVSQEAAALEPETERFAYADTLLRLDRSTKRARNWKACATTPRVARRGRAASRQAGLPDGRSHRSRPPLRWFDQLAGSARRGLLLSVFHRRARRTHGSRARGLHALVEAGAGLVARGRAARLLLQKNEREAAFRMLDDHAAKDRSESLDVEFAKAALLEDAGKANGSHRGAAAGAGALSGSSRVSATRSRSSRTRRA